MELLNACKNRNESMALSLIKFSEETKIAARDISQIHDSDNNSILIWAIHNNMFDVSTNLINNNMYNANHINNLNKTALMYICEKSNSYNRDMWNNIAFKLIGEMTDIALEQINKDNLSALILACNNRLDQIVMKIIEKNKKCITHIISQSRDSVINFFKTNNLLMNVLFEGYQKYLLFDDSTQEKQNVSQTCLGCDEITDVNYIFVKCNHVSYCCDDCISKIKICPYCRTKSTVKKVFLMNSI